MIDSKPDLEELDLSNLNETERATLLRDLNRHSSVWSMALFCAAYGTIVPFLFGMGFLWGAWGIVLKIGGFVALGYWARNWSVTAALLLLALHAWMNHPFFFAGLSSFRQGLSFQLFYWIPLIVFGWACVQGIGRRALIKKAEQD